MTLRTSLPASAQALLPDLDELTAWCVGLLGLDGRILYANRGMLALLGAQPGQAGSPDLERFVNPSFAELAERVRSARDGELVFAGLLTAGDGRCESRSLKARVWHAAGCALISAEHDVQELERLNQELAAINRQVNRLQRELLKKNRLLERPWRG